METPDPNRQIERKLTLREEGRSSDLRHLSLEERLRMMWQLAVDAWAMKGERVSEQEFHRHIERVIRGRR
jgi:hypothetical protein